MVMRILDGDSVRNIPILREGPTKYMFDYIQMKRFGISLSDLPEGSIILNEPESFYYLYKGRIWAVFAIIAGLAAITVILSANILRRKKAEEKLKQYQFMVESAHDAIFFKDLESRYIIANNETLETFGLPREQVIGKNDYELMPNKEEARKNIEDDQLVFKMGKLTEITKHMTSKEGERRWFQAIKVAQFDGRGNIVGLVGIARDITSLKLAEARLLDYQRQLKSLASELSLTEERERHRIATELHDRISQSLVISKTNLEVLRESASSKELVKTLDEVCNSLDQTIQNTRLLTSDLSSPILYELGFEAAVSEWLVEQIQEKHGIASEFEDDGQPKPLDDDICALLFRMVRELLINVVKHAQAHRVKVSIRKVDSDICVGVEDDGVGFNPAKMASMLTETGGFGLFSIRERLEQLGGHLEIESEPGHGTRVTVMAPLKQGKINREGQE